MNRLKLVDQHLDEEWYEEHLEGSPIFVSLASHTMGGNIEPMKRQYKMLLNFFHNNMTHFTTLVEDQQALFDEMLTNYMDDENFFNDWFKIWKKRTQKFEEKYRHLKGTDLKDLDDPELFFFHKKFWNSIFSSRKISMMLDAFTFESERRITIELEKFTRHNNLDNFSELLTALTSPEYESFLNKFHLEIIQLARRNDAQVQDLSLPVVRKHLDDYSWIRCSWGQAYEYSEEDLYNEIKELEGKNLFEIEKERKEFLEGNRKRRRKILREYDFTDTIRIISDLIVFCTYWQDLRKINALKFIYGESLFLKEFARRFNKDYKELLLFDIEEIEGALKGDYDLEQRKKIFMTVHHDKKMEMLFGDDAKYYYDKIIDREIAQTRELKGTCGSQGKAKGKVKIIHNPKEFDNFAEGEVLVTGMTRPEFVVLMKKAKAIVTNDGGITSHAAIISRELGKPCVIGTRNATKLLKDGDIVEVDADNGKVRKL